MHVHVHVHVWPRPARSWCEGSSTIRPLPTPGHSPTLGRECWDCGYGCGCGRGCGVVAGEPLRRMDAPTTALALAPLGARHLSQKVQSHSHHLLPGKSLCCARAELNSFCVPLRASLVLCEGQAADLALFFLPVMCPGSCEGFSLYSSHARPCGRALPRQPFWPPAPHRRGGRVAGSRGCHYLT